MKPIKKKTANWFIAFIVIFAVIGSLVAFVPMPLGNVTYTSLLGTINVSNELGGGVYAEYDLDGDYTTNQINKSIATIREVLAENGKSGSTIFSLNNKKVRVEIGYPNSASSLRDAYSLLNAIGVGVFELRSSSSEDDTFINGKDHIKSVELNNYNDTIYVVLNFNKAGEKAYADLLEASSTIYVCMGGEVMTSFDNSNATASSSLPLSFTEYQSARDFMMRVKLGSLDVKLNPDTVIIDTMSNTLNKGSMSADPQSKNFDFSIAKIMAIVAVVFMIVLGLAYMAIEYGVMGGFMALALLFDAIIAVAVLSAFTMVEISFSSIIAIGFGFALVMATALIFMSRFKEEFNQGKTINASLESGFKRSLGAILSTSIALAIIFAIVAIVASAELKVFGLITCVFAILSLFSSLIMLPGFINIFEAYNDGAIKPYRLKEREEQDNE